MDSNQFQMSCKTMLGLEDVLAEELKDLGAQNIKVSRRIVLFDGDQELLYKANYCLATALNVLKPLHKYNAKNDDELYKQAYDFPWEEILHTRQTFMITPSVRSEHFTHSKYASLKIKDAIVDRFRDKFGERPSIDRERPDIVIDLNVRNEHITLSLNSSGPPLFMRGYRKTTGEAPINEVLAAGMIRLTKWDKKSPFIDPMCGSGTLPIEAAMYSANVPAGHLRRFFSFVKWKDFDQELWDKVKEEANSKIQPLSTRVRGTDTSIAMIKKARFNAKELNELFRLSFDPIDIRELLPPLPGSVIVFNPPYGERISSMNGIESYKELGDIMKDKFKGCECWIITSDREEIKHIGLKTSQRINLMNGALDCTFRKYELY